jgi:RNA polymerase sigma factor (sigma-70 family)
MSEDESLAANPHLSRAELRRLHPEAFSWAMSRTGRDKHEAEDILQTTYERILCGAARFDGRSAAKTWLFSVIARIAASRRRQRALHQLLQGRWAALASDEIAVDVDARLDGVGTMARVRRALGLLPARQRDVLELVFYRGLTLDEASRVLGCTLGSCRRHYARAKEAMQRCLEQDA